MAAAGYMPLHWAVQNSAAAAAQKLSTIRMIERHLVSRSTGTSNKRAPVDFY